MSNTRWTSLYLQDQMSLLDGGRLKLLLGGRFDDVLTEGSAGGVALADVKDSAVTGRIGLLHMLIAQFDTALKLDPYAVFDIGAWYRWKNVKAGLNLKNLFDKRYIARASSNAIAHPGAPRTVMASVSVGF